MINSTQSVQSVSTESSSDKECATSSTSLSAVLHAYDASCKKRQRDFKVNSISPVQKSRPRRNHQAEIVARERTKRVHETIAEQKAANLEQSILSLHTSSASNVIGECSPEQSTRLETTPPQSIPPSTMATSDVDIGQVLSVAQSMPACPVKFECTEIFSDGDGMSCFEDNVAQSSPPPILESNAFDFSDVFKSGLSLSDDDTKLEHFSDEFLFDVNVAQSTPAPSHNDLEDLACFDVNVAQSSTCDSFDVNDVFESEKDECVLKQSEQSHSFVDADDIFIPNEDLLHKDTSVLAQSLTTAEVCPRPLTPTPAQSLPPSPESDKIDDEKVLRDNSFRFFCNLEDSSTACAVPPQSMPSRPLEPAHMVSCNREEHPSNFVPWNNEHLQSMKAHVATVSSRGSGHAASSPSPTPPKRGAQCGFRRCSRSNQVRSSCDRRITKWMLGDGYRRMMHAIYKTRFENWSIHKASKHFKIAYRTLKRYQLKSLNAASTDTFDKGGIATFFMTKDMRLPALPSLSAPTDGCPDITLSSV